ncbi:MAG TPA: hypothetical protein VMB23_10835, partial [Spirochaetia bacterium]|nr:hypothetical protein [Spirochaetia bacterium]
MDAFLGTTNTLNTAARTGVPGAGTTSGGLSLTGGEVVTVGQNFYDHGAPMDGAAAWTLTLSSAKWSTKALNASKQLDWFGLPFAVAVTTAPAVQPIVRNSTASQPVAAAQTGAASFQSLGTNALWDFSQPTISGASTRFDNLVELTFSEALLNTQNEAQSSVAATNVLDDLRFGASGEVTAGTLLDFWSGTAGASGASFGSGEYQTRAATAANKAVLSFQTSTAGTWTTWNTDATGSSAVTAVNGGQGAGASTDRASAHQSSVPDLTLEKGRLHDASGNPVVNYDAVNYNGTSASPSARFTTTLDKARPVLISVQTGQASKHFPPSTPQDGHNYWHLVWSEPVDLDPSGLNLTSGTLGTAPSASTKAAGNTKATLAFGDSYTDDAGLPNQVQVTGLFRYPGTLYRSTRSAATQATQAAPAQLAADKTSNSLARTSVHDLYVYLTGASSDDQGTGSGTSQYWDGFWWGASEPHGQNFTVSSGFVNQVTDTAGNPVEDENVSWAAPSTGTDPKLAYKVAALADPTASQTIATLISSGTAGQYIGQTWELEKPAFAPYVSSQSTGTSYEVVPLDTNNNDVVDQVQ